MNFVAHMKTTAVIRLVVALLLLTLVGVALLAWKTSHADAAATQAHESRMHSYLLADELRQSSDDLTRLARTFVVTGDPKWEQQYNEILAIRSGHKPRPENYERIYWDFRAASDAPLPQTQLSADLIDLMKAAGMTDAELAKLAEARANSDGLVKTETVAMNMVKGLYDDGKGNFTVKGEPDLAKAREMMHDLAYHQNKAKIMAPVNEFLTMLDQRTRDRIVQAESETDNWRQLLWGFGLGMLLLSACVVYAALKAVAQGLNQSKQVADRVAAGDLSVVPEMAGDSELSQMNRSLALMVNHLRKLMVDLSRAADSINTASNEIASGNQDLSARTEQAASNLEETAASMEELTATVRQSADAARQANQLAASASSFAVRGGEVVGQVVTTMEEINHSSKKINDIIGVIDGIAFQTNILALNAAVEAARAGEQGRGFAVVAAEVRSLAQRSAEAAKEIKGLIGTSVDKVEAGTRLVADAGQTMSEIVGSVQRVSDIIGEITAASGEQSDGIGQVNVAVTQLDQMTQQNAALVEESAAAAESLKDQAVRLTQVMQLFRLDGAASAPPAAYSPAPARAAAHAVQPKPLVSRAKAAPPARASTASRAAPATASAPVVAAQPVASHAPVAQPAKAPVAAGAEGDWESF